MKFILTAVLLLAGKEPQMIHAETPTLEACIASANNILLHPKKEMQEALETGGALSAGCGVVYPPGVKS